MRRNEIPSLITTNTSPINKPPSFPYRPFIIPRTTAENTLIKFANFEEFENGNLNDYYTTDKANVSMGELQVFLLKHNHPMAARRTFGVVDDFISSNQPKSYISDIIAPFYDYIGNNILNPQCGILQTVPPIAHRMMWVTTSDINNPNNIHYCRLGDYTDDTIRRQHRVTPSFIRGGKTTRKRKIVRTVKSRRRQ